MWESQACLHHNGQSHSSDSQSNYLSRVIISVTLYGLPIWISVESDGPAKITHPGAFGRYELRKSGQDPNVEVSFFLVFFFD